MKFFNTILTSGFLLSTSLIAFDDFSYTIVDTAQKNFYDDKGSISKPKNNDNYFGQDSSYTRNKPTFTNNQNGTITDNNTGLIWQKEFSKKLTWSEAKAYAKQSKLAGFNDWRIPTIKELYSLIEFNGQTGSGQSKSTRVPSDAIPYINTNYFDFEYGKTNRYIDAQYWTKTDYVSRTMNNAKTFFGVNFADGRIKGYPKYNKGRFGASSFYLRLVRGNSLYGENDFVANGKTIKDNASGLTWMKDDSKKAMNWKKSLGFCEVLSLGGYDDWRLPHAKELQSIVDYTKSPSTSNSASIDSLFNVSKIKNEKNQTDYPFYWTSTTHLDGPRLGANAVYVSFGRALGYMKTPLSSSKELLDVHGAGAQRSDPKSGNASRFESGRGPQGDVIRIENYVRCVRDDETKINQSKDYEVTPQQSFKRKKQDRSSSQAGFSSSSSNNMALKRFDKNRDNKISYDEAPQKMQENFLRHDLDNSGYLENEELETLPRGR